VRVRTIFLARVTALATALGIAVVAGSSFTGFFSVPVDPAGRRPVGRSALLGSLVAHPIARRPVRMGRSFGTPKPRLASAQPPVVSAHLRLPADGLLLHHPASVVPQAALRHAGRASEAPLGAVLLAYSGPVGGRQRSFHEGRREDPDFGVNTLHGPSRLQPSHDRQPPVAADRNAALAIVGKQRVGAERHGDIVLMADLDSEKAGAGDAGNGERTAVEPDSAADGSRVPGRFALPESEADYRGGDPQPNWSSSE